MVIRKSLSRLTSTERDSFLEAVLTLKNTIANPGSPNPISIYDQFVGIHYGITRVIVGMSAFDLAHGVPWFLSWHREFIRRYELALQSVNPQVTLPYWDWTDHTGTSSIIFQDNFMGPDGSGGADQVMSGYFAFNAPGALPAWWPAGLPGWRVRADLDQGGNGTTLTRDLQNTANLATSAHMQATLNQVTANGFWQALEGGPRMHNAGHNWIRGHMLWLTSPNDPMFFFHHANVDRLWAMWQIDGHSGAAWFPAGAGLGSDDSLPMWPWDAGANPANLPATVELPDFSADPTVNTLDVLDHRAMGYSYDTEPVVGILLDRSGSMLGPTPHPITGAVNVSKWEAATLGVQHFLQDCEAAYVAKEAYVTAGVNTFTTSGGVSTFDKVFAAPGYGLVKNGATIDVTNFNAQIAAMSPGGATPIGGGLVNTETTIVRPPFGNMPASEQRYMCVLTDGLENVAPLLSSLGTPEFADTVLFAMGFGIGGGVSYILINDIVSKGRNLIGVTQTFHGETAGEIDKYYSNSIAESIGYTPMVDPIVELYPGEFAMIPFYVNNLDNHIMITAQGHNFNNKDWRYTLMTPGGDMVTKSTNDPVFFHKSQQNGRATMFLKVDPKCCEDYVGRWHVIVQYKVTPKVKRMMMASPAHMLRHSGSLPLHGQIYSARKVTTARRATHRGMLFQQMQFPEAVPPGKAPKDKDPCAVTVHVYTKCHTLVNLNVPNKFVTSGDHFSLDLQFNSLHVDNQTQLRVTSRVIAPRFNIGAALADPETIPFKKRKKYIQEDKRTESNFNLADYLADYEIRRPDFFQMRDQQIKFEQKHPTQFVAVYQAEGEGVQKIGISINGQFVLPDGTRQNFSRTLNTEVFVVDAIDLDVSYTKLHWLPYKAFIVEVYAKNQRGELFNPLSIPSSVYFGKHEIPCEKLIQPDGSVVLKGSLPRGVQISKRGKLSERKRRIQGGIVFSNGRVTVDSLPYVMSADGKKIYESGSTHAKKVEPGMRRYFKSKREANMAVKKNLR